MYIINLVEKAPCNIFVYITFNIYYMKIFKIKIFSTCIF